MEFSELFTESAQLVLPLARAKGLVSHFDYQGPYIEVPGIDAPLKSAHHRVLLAMTDCIDSGFLLFVAEASKPCLGTSLITVSAAASGERASAAVIDAVLARLDLQRGPGPAQELIYACGVCPVTGGKLEFRDAGAEGLLLSLRLEVAAVEVLGAESQPDAAGAAAWLVSPMVGGLSSVERRLRRSGWHTRGFDSLPQVAQQLDRGTRAPMLLIAAESGTSDLVDMAAIAAARPALWPVLGVLAGSETLQARGDTPVDVRLLPLSPLELEGFTAHVDGRISSAASRETSPAPMYAMGRYLLLVVDDSDINQIVVRAQLQLLGYDVDVADNGSHAIESCHRYLPDLVLMDVDMPVMGGLEATRQICARQQVGQLPPFPVVATTASDDPARRTACHAAGMAGYLVKPITLDLLAGELRRLLPSRPVAHG